MGDDALAFTVHKVTSCGEAAVTVRPYPVVCPTVELGLLVQLPRRKCPIFPLAEPAMHASSRELFFQRGHHVTGPAAGETVRPATAYRRIHPPLPPQAPPPAAGSSPVDLTSTDTTTPLVCCGWVRSLRPSAQHCVTGRRRVRRVSSRSLPAGKKKTYVA